MRQVYRALFWVTLVLSAACLVGMAASAWYVRQLALENRSWQETVDKELALQHLNPPPTSTAANAALTPEQKAELQNSIAGARASLIAEIRAADADQRAILDRLITLVSVFSAILGLCAFATVKLARDDAKDQAKRIEGDLAAFKTQSNTDLTTFRGTIEGGLTTLKTTTETDLNTLKIKIEAELSSFRTTEQTELATFKNAIIGDLEAFKVKTLTDTSGMKAATEGSLESTRETTRLKLEELTRNVTTQIEDFQRKIWSELPEMRNLKDSLRNLMLELERTIPNVADWNEAAAYESLSGATRESILIAESTMNALQIFVSRDSQANAATQAGLYRSLARFYFGRFRADSVDADAQRADIYARKAGELEPGNPATDRVRGSIYLAQYRIVKKAAGQAPTMKDTERMNALLKTASDFLKDAMKMDPTDAGAALNLALAARYRENFDEAIRISNDAIGNRDKMNSLQVQKYLPSLYLNLACYLARRADRQADADAQNNGRKEAVKALSDGMEYLEGRKNAEGVTALREMIMRELRRQDAFKNLGKENLDAVEALASVKRQADPSSGGTQPGDSTPATP